MCLLLLLLLLLCRKITIGSSCHCDFIELHWWSDGKEREENVQIIKRTLNRKWQKTLATQKNDFDETAA